MSEYLNSGLRDHIKDNALSLISSMWKRGTDFLGSRYAILGGAMAWISEHNLVSAISNAGGFGVIAGGSLSPDMLKEEIQKTKKKTIFPFGVNVIAFHPNINELIAVCCEEKVRCVFFGGGLAQKASIDALHKAGVAVVCFATSPLIGKRLVRSGVDALVIEGSEAGGHINSVSTSVLVQEILPTLISEVPIFIAGGIGSGSTILSYIEMGASGCQLGTRFVCTAESIAHENFKNAFIRANSRDAIVSVQLDNRFTVAPVRALENDGMREFIEMQKRVIALFDSGEISKESAQLEIERFWAGSLRKAAIEGCVTTGSVMAGQSVGMVKSIDTCENVIQSLIREMTENILKRGSLYSCLADSDVA
ncbi:NAD(P)H-dependent flavin oxidoreductase [Candidatus Hydrogenosomobacter endosymbioticus]|uniref:2-nitropropane dioxygenase n=1 Tax=Candidatus Hydrogenosomobacter endosymbioticus TaxID=2558174 RepID=A0ABM7V844_9PROT|nr:nitronate monooxygenase [Candidatus Hydrogenosomobacter endosymbioticus]BDB95898.1 2-nitropropane dioxygenase [Candidatus Hydrogenosomobacter endosymbioticus]